MADQHLVDILTPPEYRPSGKTEDIVSAIRRGAWLHVTNLWLYRVVDGGVVEILFQQREPNSPVFAGLLDCSVAGYLEAGESPADGASRELREELGLQMSSKEFTLFGRHFNAVVDHRGRERKLVINEFVAQWQGELTDVVIGPSEVEAVFWVATDALRQIEYGGTAAIDGLLHDGRKSHQVLSRQNFVPNIDDYHYTIAKRIADYVGEQ